MEPLLKKGKEKRRSKELCPTTVTLEGIYFLYSHFAQALELAH